MDRHLFLATERRSRPLEAVIQREEWPQLTISVMREPPYAWSEAPIHWRFWSNLNETSHVSLRINPTDACLDSIELIGRFKVRMTGPSHRVETESVITDPLFDFSKSGAADLAVDDRIIDAKAAVELQIGEASIDVPVEEAEVAQWIRISRNIALGSGADRMLVALRFHALTSEETTWFRALADHE